MQPQQDPIRVSTADRVIGVASILLAIISAFFGFIFAWKTLTFTVFLLGIGAPICYALASAYALKPGFFWEHDVMKLGFFIKEADSGKPSAIYLANRKLTIYSLVAMGLLVDAYSLYTLFRYLQ